VSVKSVTELERALANIRSGTTILLRDGEYRLERMLDITATDVVIRSASGMADRVILRGTGMNERRVGVAVSISAARVTVADLTVGYVGYHGIQVRGESGASQMMLHNLRILDTGQQLLKGSASPDGRGPDRGIVACSLLAYTDHAPSDYTGGIGVLAGRSWTVRDNRFERIRGPGAGNWASGPAILFWANSADTIVERNVVIDSFRGIAFGLGPGASSAARDGERQYDHQNGVISHNVVANLHPWGDEGIEVNAARNARIENNTVVVQGRLPWSISVRFAMTSGLVQNNLTNQAIMFRDGGQAELAGNIDQAQSSWFVDAARGDMRLLPDIEVGDAGAFPSTP
jgi:hypothetical protein